jgi:hypothetical protein
LYEYEKYYAQIAPKRGEDTSFTIGKIFPILHFTKGGIHNKKYHEYGDDMFTNKTHPEKTKQHI